MSLNKRQLQNGVDDSAGATAIATDKAKSPKRRRRPVTGWRKWLFRILAATVVPAMFLLLLNFSLWLCGYGYPTDFFVKIEGRESYTTNRQFGWRFFPKPIARAPHVCEFAAPKPDEVYRVFVLGGSAARGTPKAAFSFGRYLEVMLQDAYPGVKFEVVNAAVTAVNSHVVREIAHDCARYQGDLFVVYMGNNEVIGPYGTGTVFTGHYSSLAVIRTSIWLKTTKIGQLIDSIDFGGARVTEWKGLEMFLENQIAADDPRLADVYSHFKDNTTDILNVAKGSGAKVVLCTVATNLKDCAPFGSLHDENLDDSQLAKWKQHYEAGIQLFSTGKHGEAVDQFLDAAAIDDHPADLAFRLGSGYVELEQFDKARESFTRAQELDTVRIRADSQINRIIRELADENESEGVHFVDAQQVFEANAQTSHNLPGQELFYEHVHLKPEGNYVLAAAVFEQVTELLPKWIRNTATVEVSAASQDRCEKVLALTDWDRYLMEKAIFFSMEKPPHTNQFDYEQRREMRVNELRAFKRRGTSREALQEAQQGYRTAIELDPDDLDIRLNYAEFLQGTGEFEASAEHLQALLARFPNSPEWRRLLADALAGEGKFDSAIAEYRKVMRNDPRYTKEIYLQIGLVYMNQDKFEQALKNFRLALAMEGNLNAEQAYLNIGFTYQKQGKSEEALENYRLALAVDENFAQAHLNIATVLAEQGDLSAATQHCRQALAIDPDNADVCLNLGKVLAQQRLFEEAAIHLRKAISLRPGFALDHYNLADVLFDGGLLREAIAEYQQAIKLDPVHAELRYGYGRVLLRTNELAQGIAQLQRSIELEPEFVPAHLLLGVGFELTGRLPEAMTQYQKVLTLHPGHRQANEALERLQGSD